MTTATSAKRFSLRRRSALFLEDLEVRRLLSNGNVIFGLNSSGISIHDPNSTAINTYSLPVTGRTEIVNNAAGGQSFVEFLQKTNTTPAYVDVVNPSTGSGYQLTGFTSDTGIFRVINDPQGGQDVYGFSGTTLNILNPATLMIQHLSPVNISTSILNEVTDASGNQDIVGISSTNSSNLLVVSPSTSTARTIPGFTYGNTLVMAADPNGGQDIYSYTGNFLYQANPNTSLVKSFPNFASSVAVGTVNDPRGGQDVYGTNGSVVSIFNPTLGTVTNYNFFTTQGRGVVNDPNGGQDVYGFSSTGGAILNVATGAITSFPNVPTSGATGAVMGTNGVQYLYADSQTAVSFINISTGTVTSKSHPSWFHIGQPVNDDGTTHSVYSTDSYYSSTSPSNSMGLIDPTTGNLTTVNAFYTYYGWGLINVTNGVSEAAGITVSPTTGLTTTESGGTATFTIALNSRPNADVTIPISSDNISEGTVSPRSLTFTPTNWYIPQTVGITGVDDSIVDGNKLYHIVTGSATSADTRYKGFNPADVSVTNLDNDTAGITVSPTSGLITTESGGAASFTIVLNSQPTANVTIPVSSDNNNEGTISPANLTFTPANWNIPQSVAVTGVDDLVADGDQLYHIVTGSATSPDPLYNGINPADVSVTNLDNDIAGITVSPTSGLITTEAGGTASFTVVLNSQPTADVTIPLSSSDTTEGIVTPSSVTFTAANWNIPQTVTITGVDDSVVDGDVGYNAIVGPAVSVDSNYNGMDASDVSIVNLDNDLDIQIQALGADGATTLTISYVILGQAPVPFDIGIYQSSGSRLDGSAILLATVSINTSADLSVGTHTKSYTIGNGSG